MGLFSKFQNWMSGGDTSDEYDKANELINEANKTLANRAKSKKSTDQIIKEGRAAAGQAAADKAGIAKQNAAAAARMGGAGKLQSALAGAGAAQQASSSGYVEQANQAAGLEANREAQLDEMANLSAQNTMQKANLETQKAENAANRRASMMQNAAGIAAAALSDGKTKTYKKHNYLAKEER